MEEGECGEELQRLRNALSVDQQTSEQKAVELSISSSWHCSRVRLLTYKA